MISQPNRTTHEELHQSTKRIVSCTKCRRWRWTGHVLKSRKNNISGIAFNRCPVWSQARSPWRGTHKSRRWLGAPCVVGVDESLPWRVEPNPPRLEVEAVARCSVWQCSRCCPGEQNRTPRAKRTRHVKKCRSWRCIGHVLKSSQKNNISRIALHGSRRWLSACSGCSRLLMIASLESRTGTPGPYRSSRWLSAHCVVGVHESLPRRIE